MRRFGFELAVADVTQDKDERALLQSLGGALGFPEYYRPNWDAFDDCLGDLIRQCAAPTALAIEGGHGILRSYPRTCSREQHIYCTRRLN